MDWKGKVGSAVAFILVVAVPQFYHEIVTPTEPSAATELLGAYTTVLQPDRLAELQEYEKSRSRRLGGDFTIPITTIPKATSPELSQSLGQAAREMLDASLGQSQITQLRASGVLAVRTEVDGEERTFKVEQTEEGSKVSEISPLTVTSHVVFISSELLTRFAPNSPAIAKLGKVGRVIGYISLLHLIATQV